VALAAGRTRLTLELGATGSCFVVFRATPTAGRTKPPPVAATHTEIVGPWRLSFPSKPGASAQVTFDRLTSWTEHPDENVRHFSGTATYRKTLTIPADSVTGGRRVFLNLGDVMHIARVRLNGAAFPALWKPPYRVEVTSAARDGDNTLEIEVTNLWPNRLIGDEQEPDDCEWGEMKTFMYVDPPVAIGRHLMLEPDWVREGRPRPASGRQTFTSFKFFTKDIPLLKSGLFGPVMIEMTQRVERVP
jgi:hypothetical protein